MNTFFQFPNIYFRKYTHTRRYLISLSDKLTSVNKVHSCIRFCFVGCKAIKRTGKHLYILACIRKAKPESGSTRVRSQGKHIKDTTSLVGNVSRPIGELDAIRSITTEIRSVLRIEGEKIYGGFSTVAASRN